MRNATRTHRAARGPRDLPAGAQTGDAAPGAIEASAGDAEARIREAAYLLYEQRGGVDGHDVDDWLEAEAMLSRHDAGELQAGEAADAGH
jgi:hypothetical protein